MTKLTVAALQLAFTEDRADDMAAFLAVVVVLTRCGPAGSRISSASRSRSSR